MLVGGLVVPAVVCGLAACVDHSNQTESSDTKTVTVTASTAAPIALQPGSWDYLQSHYSGYLSLTCDPQQPTGGNYSACIGLQNAKLEDFRHDVTALPQSESKTDLLTATVLYSATYQNYANTMCLAMDPTQPPCFEIAQSLRNAFTLIAGIVNRVAAK